MTPNLPQLGYSSGRTDCAGVVEPQVTGHLPLLASAQARIAAPLTGERMLGMESKASRIDGCLAQLNEHTSLVTITVDRCVHAHVRRTFEVDLLCDIHIVQNRMRRLVPQH
jgi:hypothetical protein